MPRFPRRDNEPFGDLLREIGQQIRAERKKRSLTQHQLAELSGIAQTSISLIENGLLDIQVSTLHRFAEGMGMTYHELAASGAQPVGTVEDA